MTDILRRETERTNIMTDKCSELEGKNEIKEETHHSTTLRQISDVFFPPICYGYQADYPFICSPTCIYFFYIIRVCIIYVSSIEYFL